MSLHGANPPIRCGLECDGGNRTAQLPSLPPRTIRFGSLTSEATRRKNDSSLTARGSWRPRTGMYAPNVPQGSSQFARRLIAMFTSHAGSFFRCKGYPLLLSSRRARR